MALSSIRPGAVDRGTFERFRSSIEPAWIEEALSSTGKVTLRKRRLPGEQVCWLVIGMALFRDLSIEEVVRQLDLALPARSGGEVVSSAVTQARARIGSEPLRWLFERVGSEWAHRSAATHRWRRLQLYGVDGTTVRIPDSAENRQYFGPTEAGESRGLSGYPLVRLVTLMALRSHLLVSARCGPYGKGEITHAKDLWEMVPDESLTMVDRGFFSAAILVPLARDGRRRHWLCRARKDFKWKRVKKLGNNDEIVEMSITSHAHGLDPSLARGAPWQMRAIRHKRRGFRPQTLLTSMLDPKAYPATEIAELYHERWELELGFDEVKTEMLEREECIRSRRPDGVLQELWGLLLAYNLVRFEMEQVAAEARVPPSRISFIAGLRFIRTTLLGLAFTSPGAIPKRLQHLRADLRHFVLPARRRHRSYPRVVKIKMSNYDRKRPTGDARRWPGAAH